MTLTYDKAFPLCYKYSDNPETLKHLLENPLNEKQFSVEAYDMGNQKDFNIVMQRGIGKDRKEISFIFHQSIQFQEIMQNVSSTEESKNEQWRKFLYVVLCCCKMDAFIPDSFDEFCAEFGYNPDSIKAEKLYDACLLQCKKLNSFFTQKELESFPS